MKVIHKKDGLINKEKFTEKALEFGPNTVLNIQLKTGQAIPEHHVGEHLLVIVRKGKILFDVEGEKSELSPDTFIYLDPNEKHSLKAMEDSDVLVLRIK